MEKIWVDKNERFFNVAATVKHDGATYNGNVLNFPDVVAELGLHEVELEPLPLDYSTDTHYLTMQDSAPYRVVTRKSDEQIGELRWSKIKTKRDSLIENGGCLVAGKWFHSDAKSKQQQIALTLAGASVPTIPWKTMDGSFITLSQSLVAQVFQAQMLREQAIFAHAETLNADPEADIDAGWPEHYEAAQ